MKLKGELEAAGLLNWPEVVAAGFWPNALGAFPVLPPKVGVLVPETGFDEEPKRDGCCVPLGFAVAPAPKMLAADCDEDAAGVEPPPNRPPVVPEGGFAEVPNNGLLGVPFPLPLPKLNDMIADVVGDGESRYVLREVWLGDLWRELW